MKQDKIHSLPKKKPKTIKNKKISKNKIKLTNKQRVQSEITYLSYTIL